MIDLATDIIIYPHTYPALNVVRLEVDFRGQSGSFHLAPVKLTDAALYLGVEERTDDGAAYRYPNLVRVITLAQNQDDPDPILHAILRSLVVWLEENIDPILAQALTGQAEQIGTTLWALDGTAASLGTRAVTNELSDLRSPPTPAELNRTTVDPTVTIE